MKNSPIKVKRLDIKLLPDPSRVIARLFCPGDENRIRGIIKRVLAIPDETARRILARVEADFKKRHPDIKEILMENFEAVQGQVPEGARLDARKKRFIGSYFTMEYSIEAAALFNPSMVPARDQDNLPEGSTRFVMSLRATGEGHISSIVFRRGVIDRDDNIQIEERSPYSRQLEAVENRTYLKGIYRLKLNEMIGASELADFVMESLDEEFTYSELCAAIKAVREKLSKPAIMQELEEDMIALARANYQLSFPEEMEFSSAVIFPNSENERRGLEDVRLVRFQDDDGSVCYYGTYTAFNGFHILPQIFEIRDRQLITIHTLNGCFSKNKGLALFPRKIRGRYMMISRVDNENLFLMDSDNVLVWNDAWMIQTPRFPWELVQIGNCGSPLETDEGWLLLTHGVGPMRQYCIGATLLDLDDPGRIIGQTREPLLVPTGEERTGYVPNVVYSCGGMIHHDTLVIPYAMSDISTSFATLPLPELLKLLKS
jgi:predicted GH43/DUF377 family glycosyl hydrolase